MLRGEVGTRALRVRSVSREEAWASAGVQGARVCCVSLLPLFDLAQVETSCHSRGTVVFVLLQLCHSRNTVALVLLGHYMRTEFWDGACN